MNEYRSKRSSRVGDRSELAVYNKQMRGLPLLTAEEEQLLGRAIINDHCSVARERLIRSNLRLVISIAKQYCGRGMELPDLVEEGNVGLLRAVDRFDPAVGTRFSTYASWWIKQAIVRGLATAVRPIHVPHYLIPRVRQCKEARSKLARELGREPSLQELSAELRLSLKKVRFIEHASRALHGPRQGWMEMNGEAVNIHDLLADERTAAPEDNVLRDEQRRIVNRFLDTIDTREARIVRLRFGLEGREPLTLYQIGEEVGVSRERVRQLSDQAVCKLHALVCDAR